MFLFGSFCYVCSPTSHTTVRFNVAPCERGGGAPRGLETRQKMSRQCQLSQVCWVKFLLEEEGGHLRWGASIAKAEGQGDRGWRA